MLTRVNRVLYPIALEAMFLLAPERIHSIIMASIRTTSRLGIARTLLARLFTVPDPVLRQEVFGVTFPAPLGLAAGFDKSAAAADAWGLLGFGYAEVGTVTGQAQPGNPPPRLFRLPADRALINRMGFNNPGAPAAADNLTAARGRGIPVPIGANIGKTKVVPLDGAVEDYRISARLLGPHADFVVVNVSSPNTPGLRDLQAVDSLRPILAAVLDEVSVPVLVKIAPDLADADVDTVADLAVELGLAGIVATNTTISRDGLTTPPDEVEAMGPGGLSGAPLADRSLEVLRRLYSRVGGKLALISVGGIETPEQAWERICAGADLLQSYTGFIYGGPMRLREIHEGIAARVRAAGWNNISEAVGSAARG
ncbi:quinone-dependent dihydroorotate dehydrogenase [Gordonia sp. 852002-50395_SCH5434458]|uniref:quinone-dependent dihydroorotate dehydrogenase n=1 Tax=Gordonia sp. 852002-50395_SCH5434458 TaxID=1834090 RepID=UPI0007EA4314|nr:quinone-dependent dihydroorotate dehydrogenase [Gordonia sp. 852002-50395_SCH5434458]OBC02838.1 dihydroorotate dehydrogenase (quinone) [Gordonia sp. 852002-50395_SCH5434458]